ncbi:hypothetical protein ABPG74_008725 [Tetrahymena malaccensis]
MTINLNESHLSDEILKNFSIIFQKTQVQENLQLSLVSCKIESFQIISEMLQSKNNLVYLNLNMSAVNMFNNQIEFICKGIRNYSNLQKLKLDLAGCTIQDQGMEKLAECLIQLKKLNYLDLNVSQNKLGEESGNYFSTAICSLQELAFLKINLVENQIFTSDLLANSIKNLGSLKNLQEIQIQVFYRLIGQHKFQLQYQSGYLFNFCNQLSKFIYTQALSIVILPEIFQHERVCQYFNEAIILMSKLKILRIYSFYGNLNNLNQLLNGIQFHQSLIYLNIHIESGPSNLTKHSDLKKTKRLVFIQS